LPAPGDRRFEIRGVELKQLRDTRDFAKGGNAICADHAQHYLTFLGIKYPDQVPDSVDHDGGSALWADPVCEIRSERVIPSGQAKPGPGSVSTGFTGQRFLV
jgi:hypothetical protein